MMNFAPAPHCDPNELAKNLFWPIAAGALSILTCPLVLTVSNSVLPVKLQFTHLLSLKISLNCSVSAQMTVAVCPAYVLTVYGCPSPFLYST